MTSKTDAEAKRKSFRRDDKIRMLRWCNRHCCLCGRARGVDVEIAHIGDRTDNSFDNGIPVCYDCHAKMGAYNDLHARGNKLSADELKATRELIYERYTRPYAATVDYCTDQAVDPWNPKNPKRRKFPDVTFAIRNLSTHLPTRLKIVLVGLLNGKRMDLGLRGPLYRGEKWWNLNPQRGVLGHFEITNPRLQVLQLSDRFEVRVRIIQKDPLEREHALLEDGYVYKTGDTPMLDSWYFEP